MDPNNDQVFREEEMLVLSRKRGERIVLGDGIEISVVEVRGGRVRIGIEAPRHVPVRRWEMTEQPCPNHSTLPRPIAGSARNSTTGPGI